MFAAGAAAGDWALRRILKFVLKRSLRHIIKTQIDLEQLNVQLGQGTLELREVLLNTNFLNQHLAELPWEFTAAFVGSVAAVLPLAALYSEACTVRLDEVFLTLRPKPPAAAVGAAPPAGAADGGGAAGGAAAAEWQGETAVSEGVKLIAGGLEALLQRLRVTASRVVLRLEIPAAAGGSSGGGGSSSNGAPDSDGSGQEGTCYHVVTLGLAQAEYSGNGGGLGDPAPGTGAPGEAAGEEEGAAAAGAAAGGATTLRVAKSLRFSGLLVELEPHCPAEQQQQQEHDGEQQEGERGLQRAPQPQLQPCSLLAGGDGGGCSGAVDLTLAWWLRTHPKPHISLSIQLDPFHIHLRPEDVLLVAAIAAAAAQLPREAASSGRAAVPSAAAAAPTLPLPEHLHPGSRSFIEGLMLPDCEGVVAEALAEPAAPAGRPGEGGAITGQEELDEFFDAKSLLGSLQSSCALFFASAHESLGSYGSGSQYQSQYQSQYHSHYSSLGGSPRGGGGGGAALEGGPAGAAGVEVSLYQAHDLAASVRQLGAEEPLEWEVALAVPAFNLSLRYPPAALAAAATASTAGSPASTPSSPSTPSSGSSASSSKQYTPRLSIDLGEVSVLAAGGAGGLQCGVLLRQLEASEHLVLPAPAAAATATAAAGQRGAEKAPPEEVARVPCVLPPLGFAPRPLPAIAGCYPLPCRLPSPTSPSGFGPTLSLLSDLQASVYQSALQASVFPDDQHAPRLHVLPVLSCGSGSSDGGGFGGPAAEAGACAVLHLSSGLPTKAGGSAGEGLDVVLAMQPVSLWLSIPFLERLLAFGEPIQAGLGRLNGQPAAAGPLSSGSGGTAAAAGAPPPGGGGGGGGGGGATKAAVSAAIEDILHDLQQLRTDVGGPGSSGPASRPPLRLRAHLPHVCLVAALCEGPLPPAPACHIYSYVAVDLSMGPQPGALVVQGLRQLGQAPRLGDVQALVARLAGAPFPPTLQLQRASAPPAPADLGGSRWAPAGAAAAAAAAREHQDSWDCLVSIASAALFLVGGEGAEGGPAASALGSCLFAHQVGSAAAPTAADALGEPLPSAQQAQQAQQGVLVELQWSPGRSASPGLLQDSWRRLGTRLRPAAGASEEQGRWESDSLDAFTFRQQCLQSSPLYARLSAPALEASLTPAALAALANWADGLLQLVPQPPPGQPAQPQQQEGDGSSGSGGVQVAVEVDCNASVRLLRMLGPWHSRPDPAALLFSGSAQGVQLLTVGNLSGVSGGGALVLSCDGLELRSGCDGSGGQQGGACLLHRPARATVDGRAVPGLELVHIARPQGTPSRRHPRTGRYYIPSDAQALVSLAGWTLQTEGGEPGLPWLQRLAGFFALTGSGGASGSAGGSPAGSPRSRQSAAAAARQAQQGQLGEGEPQMRLDWALEADSLALRYEHAAPAAAASEAASSSRGGGLSTPEGGEPVAAVLVVGSLACQGEAEQQATLPLALRCLAVYVAAAGQREGDWAPSTPQHAAGGQLAAAGYTCVATEGEMAAAIPLAPPPTESPAPAAAVGGPAWQLEVTNHLLNVTLTQHSMLLLLQLGRQLGEAAEQRQSEQQQAQVQQQGAGAPARRAGAEAAGGRAADEAGAAAAAGSISRGSSSSGARQSPGVDILRGVRDNEYRPAPTAQQAERLRQTVLIDGGWYESLPNEPLSPAGSPPVVIDDFFSGGAAASGKVTRRPLAAGPYDEATSEEGHGTWFDVHPPAAAAVEDAVRRQEQQPQQHQQRDLAVSGARQPSDPLDFDFVDFPGSAAGAGSPQRSGGSSSGAAASAQPGAAGGELPAWLVQEDYLDNKQGSEPRVRRALTRRSALGALPPDYPPSLSRIVLRDINVTVALSSGGMAQPGPSRRGERGPSAGDPRAELQLQLQRLCVQVDSFGEQAQHARRIAASLHTLEFRELRGSPGSISPAPLGSGSGSGGSAAQRQAAEAGASPANLPASLRSSQEWRQVVCYDAALGLGRGPEAVMAAVVVEAVRPDPEGAPHDTELRLEVALLPLRLQLEQGTVAFLQRFFAPLTDTLGGPAVLVEHEDALPLPSDSGSGGAALVPVAAAEDASPAGFIQRCEVQPFSITIDYQPHSVDIAALRRGDLTEMLNLFPWGGVTLQFRHLRLFGVHDAPTLGTALASAWLEDIVCFQAHKFLAGIAPIRSLVKVSSAAVQLLAIPVEHLFAEASGPASQRSLSSLRDSSFLRQMRRGVLALVRAIAQEAMGLGASVAGGAQAVLLQQQQRARPGAPAGGAAGLQGR